MNFQLISHDDFLIRTPSFSVKNLYNLPDNPNQFFRKLYHEVFFQEAIYVASPQLFLRYSEWISGHSFTPKEENKLITSLFKYWLRISSRCTPFGLFAGYAMGNLADRTQVIINSSHEHRKYSRLDMNYLCELSEAFAKIPEIAKSVKYFPVRNIYEIQKKLRYFEATTKNKYRSYKISEVDQSPILIELLDFCNHGSTITELIEFLNNHGIIESEALTTINDLLESGLLVSEFEPTVTGDDYFHVLEKKLTLLGAGKDILDRLSFIRNKLSDQNDIIKNYEEILGSVKAILGETTSKDLIQTDLQLSYQTLLLNKNAVNTILDQVRQLFVLCNPPTNELLQNFITKFQERYENQRVDFLEALDPEIGVGYLTTKNTDDAPLLAGLFGLDKKTGSHKVPWSFTEAFKFKKLQLALSTGTDQIDITDSELELFPNDTNIEIPDSMFLMGKLIGDSHGIDSSDFQFELAFCTGPSAANLFGRFCQGDKDMTERVRHYLTLEESCQPHCIFAEVVHLPQARTGNILSRPVLRDFEIPYLTGSGVPRERQIDLEDLQISISRGEVILTSKKLGKRIIPRLSTAHNFRGNSLPVYRFLCDLQLQNSFTGSFWDWGVLSNSSFLPRVVYRNIVIRRAQWLFELKDHEDLKKSTINLKAYFQKICEERKIPQRVLIQEGDNELYVDFANERCLTILKEDLLKRTRITLVEFLGSEEKCFVKDTSGSKFCSEILIPLRVDKLDRASRAAAPHQQTPTPITRNFAVGSRWLYIKIYCGSKTTDTILRNVIKPLVTKLLDQNKINKFYFIRYRDPEHHIRIRFYGEGSFWNEVLQQLESEISPLISNRTVSRMCVDTYQRELERYGVDTMELSETLFYYDSLCVLDFIDLLESDADEKYRWLFTLLGTDLLLDSFGLKLSEKLNLLQNMQQSFMKEFNGGSNLNYQLNEKYRKEARAINMYLNPPTEILQELEEAYLIFEKRKTRLDSLVPHIKIKLNNDQQKSLSDLLSSYIHMFINRMLMSDHRKQELVIYHFLSKYYKMKVARKPEVSE